MQTEKLICKTKVHSNWSTVIVQYPSEGTARIDVDWKKTCGQCGQESKTKSPR